MLSIDDFYLSHEDQLKLAAAHSDNPLVQHRGQPSTHDLDLAGSVLTSFRIRRETRIPSYDKSSFDGQGDRVQQDKWVKWNGNGQPPVDVVILEGWCVGFRAVDDAQLTARWNEALKARGQDPGYRGRLGYNSLENVQFVNEALKAYDILTK